MKENITYLIQRLSVAVQRETQHPSWAVQGTWSPRTSLRPLDLILVLIFVLYYCVYVTVVIFFHLFIIVIYYVRCLAHFYIYLSIQRCLSVPVYKLQYFICDTRGPTRNPGRIRRKLYVYFKNTTSTFRIGGIYRYNERTCSLSLEPRLQR